MSGSPRATGKVELAFITGIDVEQHRATLRRSGEVKAVLAESRALGDTGVIGRVWRHGYR
jgi:hypothetical protein